MKTTHKEETSCGNGVTSVNSSTPTVRLDTVSEGSLFAKMLHTKKLIKGYLKGEISRSELESKGVEIV